jgi:hypothetical protein
MLKGKTNTHKPMVTSLEVTVPDSRTILVALDYPPPFNGFVNAIEYANAQLQPSLTNPVKLKFAPGVFVEFTSATLNIAAGTVIEGSSAFGTTILLANPSSLYPFLTILGYFEIADIAFNGGRIENKNGSDVSFPDPISYPTPPHVPGPTPPNADNTLIYMPAAISFNAIVIRNSSFTGAQKIIHCQSPGGIIAFSGAWGIFATVADTSNPNPNLWLYYTFDIAIHVDSQCRTVLSGTGAITNDMVTQGLIFFGPFQPQFFDYGILVESGGLLDMTGINIEAGLVGLRSNGAASVHVVGGSFLNNFTHFECATTAAYSVYSVQTVNSPLLQFVINDLVIADSVSSVICIGCNFDTARLILPSDVSNISLNYYDNNLNNERGSHFIGNLIVGDPKAPAEMLVGEGSTNIQDLTILKYDGVGFTDSTGTLSPSDLTPVVLFDDLTLSELYIGNSVAFSGLRVDIDTVIALGSGTLIMEYWDTVGAAWTTLTHMSAQHFRPHSSYADQLFTVAENQDIRFNNNITLGETTVNSITKTWVRIRIQNPPITTSPLLNNIKLIGNSLIITFTGYQLYYGKARPQIEIPFDMSWISGSPSAKPADQEIHVSKTISVNRVSNNYNTGDESTFGFYVPTTLDSSTPIEITFAFFSDSTAATQPDFVFDLIRICIAPGQPLFQTSAAAPVTLPQEQSQVINLTPDQTAGNQMVISTVTIDLSDCRASIAGSIQQVLLFRFARQADSNSNNCIFSNIGFYQTVYILGLSN